MRFRRLHALVSLAALATVALSLPASAQTDTTSSEVGPPAGASDADVSWHSIQHPDGTSQLVAVARPPKSKGKGPFPAVIALHGGSGLGPLVVDEAARMAKAGFVVVAGCWTPDEGFAGNPPWCASAPNVPTALGTLEEFTRAQPGVRKQRIAVFGMSSGAGATFNYPWGPWVRALAVDSGFGGGPTGEFVTTATVPVLLLYGSADQTVTTDLQEGFTAALRDAGVETDVQVYDASEHIVTMDFPGETAPVAKRANARLAKFLHEQLGS